jgi:uncharacterized membrane protein YgcG
LGFRRALPALALVGMLAVALPAAAELPASPARHFQDAVGLVTPGEAAQLADALYGFEQRTGIQFVVAVLPEYEGALEDYMAALYEHWGLGTKGDFRGVLFAVFPQQGASRLEVGYGLGSHARRDRLAHPAEMQRFPREPPRALQFVMRRVATGSAGDRSRWAR